MCLIVQLSGPFPNVICPVHDYYGVPLVCSIREEGFRALASALRSNPSHMRELQSQLSTHTHKHTHQGCSINRILIVITISGPNDLKTNKIEGNNVFVLIIFYCLYCTLDVYIRHFYCLYIRHQRRLTNVYEERYQGKSKGTRMFFRNVFEYIFNK